MSSVRFRAGAIDLELSGTESFVNRQLHRLTPLLGSVDTQALTTPEAPLVPESREPARPEEPDDALLEFFSALPFAGPERQMDAALAFSYYLQERTGKETFGVADLIRCCIRAGVDTRDFNRVLGTLTRRSLLETVPPGTSYRLTEQGIALVERRMEAEH